MVTDIDENGFEVKSGSRIAFSFGIPPRRVVGVLFERDGQLIMPTPDVTPKEATLDELRKHVGGFWRVDVTEAEWPPKYAPSISTWPSSTSPVWTSVAIASRREREERPQGPPLEAPPDRQAPRCDRHA